jgi:hypothetical protein
MMLSKWKCVYVTYDHDWKVPAFTKSNQEANGIQLRNARDRGGAEGQDRPQNLEKRDQNGRTHSGCQHHCWHLPDDIPCSEAIASVRQFTALHVQ